MDQNIIGLDVSMHDVGSGEHLEGLDDLPEVDEGALFGEGSLLLDKFVERAPVAELIDEVEVVGSLEHVDILDDVGAALEGRQDVDLINCAFLQLGDFSELLGLHHLDGHLLLRLQVHGFVDLRIDSLSQLLLQLVVLYYLAH